MNFINLFFIFLIISSVQPAIQRRVVESRRLNAIRTFEQQRGSRVILLIHRQESISLLGIPISKFINIEDSVDLTIDGNGQIADRITRFFSVAHGPIHICLRISSG